MYDLTDAYVDEGMDGRFHIYTEHGSDTGKSYGRRSDARRGLIRMQSRA